MSDPHRVTEVLAALRELGVRLSLDDFGTGKASLAYLKQLPLDEVKIDRAFITGMSDDDGDAVIVRSTIDLARNLGLDVVAEGVESASVLEALVDLRCNSAQGYYLSRPLPSAELDRLAQQPLHHPAHERERPRLKPSGPVARRVPARVVGHAELRRGQARERELAMVGVARRRVAQPADRAAAGADDRALDGGSRPGDGRAQVEACCRGRPRRARARSGGPSRGA